MNNLGTNSIQYGMQNMALPVRYIKKTQGTAQIQNKKPMACLHMTQNPTRKVLPTTPKAVSMPDMVVVAVQVPVIKIVYTQYRPTRAQIAMARARKHVLRNPKSYCTYSIDRAANLQQLVAEYETIDEPIIAKQNMAKHAKERADIISALKTEGMIKSYDYDMEQAYDIWECNRDMLQLFRALEQSWAAAVEQKTEKYNEMLALESYRPEPKQKKKNHISRAQMRRISMPDAWKTQHDLNMVVHAWNNTHKM